MQERSRRIGTRAYSFFFIASFLGRQTTEEIILVECRHYTAQGAPRPFCNFPFGTAHIEKTVRCDRRNQENTKRERATTAANSMTCETTARILTERTYNTRLERDTHTHAQTHKHNTQLDDTTVLG